MIASRLEGLAASVGRGLVAGLAGTAVMTVIQMIEMKLAGRAPSGTPAKAAERVLDIEPRDPRAAQRFNQLVHFAYGTGWGAVRGVLPYVVGRFATQSHLVMVWSAGLAALPVLGMAPPVVQWSNEQIRRDFVHHAVYAYATGCVYDWLAGQARRDRAGG